MEMKSKQIRSHQRPSSIKNFRIMVGFLIIYFIILLALHVKHKLCTILSCIKHLHSCKFFNMEKYVSCADFCILISLSRFVVFLFH